MGKKKHKHQGHYCKMCGEYKSNESFSSKEHKLHICKECMSKRNKTKKEKKRLEHYRINEVSEENSSQAH